MIPVDAKAAMEEPVLMDDDQLLMNDLGSRAYKSLDVLGESNEKILHFIQVLYH